MRSRGTGAWAAPWCGRASEMLSHHDLAQTLLRVGSSLRTAALELAEFYQNLASKRSLEDFATMLRPPRFFAGEQKRSRRGIAWMLLDKTAKRANPSLW